MNPDEGKPICRTVHGVVKTPPVGELKLFSHSQGKLYVLNILEMVYIGQVLGTTLQYIYCPSIAATCQNRLKESADPGAGLKIWCAGGIGFYDTPNAVFYAESLYHVNRKDSFI
jgi:hypothetical protein